ncbi:MAG: hypothetical protein KAS04_03025, partial [Candidatus Aenigmarchaeota archaeon]|nr:hypothetical protein [Candidatus Aenigmarchaeota archaeon]
MNVVNLANIKGGEALGEKAKKLSDMLKEKMPVPAGFVITKDMFEHFLKENKLKGKIAAILENVDPNDYKRLVEVSDEIKTMFTNSHFTDAMKKEIDEAYESFSVRNEVKDLGGAALDFIRAGRESIFVSVRVSATTSETSSFPGVFDTFLNVSCQKDILDAVKMAWASLYSPRAIFYRYKKNIAGASFGGIIVQRMVDSEKSGIVTNTSNAVVIEGSWGFGTSISYGLVSPDKYELDSYSGDVRNKDIRKKVWMYRKDNVTGKTSKECVPHEKMNMQVLNENEIAKVFELYKRVSDRYGQDHIVEWAINRGRIHILQARAVKNQVQNGNEEVFEGESTKGHSISSGSGKGQVRVIRNTSDFENITSGDIITTKILSPEFIPFIGKATAMISEYGSFGSSASAVCREMGMPCVSEIEISIFSDNEIVTVDGTGGQVFSFRKPEI